MAKEMTAQEILDELNRDYAVTGSSGRTYKQSELAAAFDLVAPKRPLSWKSEIDCVIPDKVNHVTLRDAIVHFTGSVPSFTIVGKKLRVKAAGYYATIGA